MYLGQRTMITNKKNVYKHVLLLSMVLLFAGVCSLKSSAQYRIDVRIKELRDSNIVLAYYFGDGRYVRDSGQLNSKGRVTFQGDTALHEGMYFLLLPNELYLDFLLGSDQKITIETDTLCHLEHTTVKGNRVSEDFASFQRFMYHVQRMGGKIDSLYRIARAHDSVNPEAQPEYKKARSQGDSLQQVLNQYRQTVIDSHKEDILGKFCLATMSVEAPPYEPEEGIKNVDSARWRHSYNYYLEHYLDNIDLARPGLLYTPIPLPKVEYYLDKMVLQIPDTLKRYVDKVLQRAIVNEETGGFYASHLLNKYQLSEIVGMDAVFVHIADNYYLNGKVKVYDTAFLSKLRKRVEDLRPNLMGNVAPDFTVQDIYGRTVQLRALKAEATVIIFWDPSCNHCQKVIPVLDSISREYASRGLQVIGFMTQGDGPAWQKYLKEHDLLHRWINVWDPYRSSKFDKLYDIYSTPVLYLLDDKQRILLKRIGVESLPAILDEILPEKK